MLRYQYCYFFLLAFIVFAAGCKEEPLPSKLYLNLEAEEFVCYASESIRPNDSNLVYIEFVTSEARFCEGAQLVGSSFSESEKSIRLKLYHVETPETCQEDQKQLSTKLLVGLVRNASYSMEIQIGQSIHKFGSLKIKDDCFHFNLEDNSNIKVEPSVTGRILEGLCWMRWSYSPDDEKLIKDGIRRIDNIQSQDIPPGFYSYFQLEGEEFQLTKNLPSQPGPLFRDHAIMLKQPEVQLNYLKNIIDNITDRGNGRVQLKLYLWDGSTIQYP